MPRGSKHKHPCRPVTPDFYRESILQLTRLEVCTLSSFSHAFKVLSLSFCLVSDFSPESLFADNYFPCKFLPGLA